MSDDESSSHSSQSSLSIDDESVPENVIRPYQFEPEFSSSEEGVEEGELIDTYKIQPLFTLGSVYSTSASGAEQTIGRSGARRRRK